MHLFRISKFQILILIIFSFSLHAEYSFWDIKGENTGHTVCGFLTIPSGTQNLSVGQASGLSSNSAEDLFYSPSNTAFFDQYYISISHMEWLMHLRKEYLSASMPILDFGTIGFYSQLFTLGTFENARNFDEEISTPKYADYTLGFSYARQIIPQRISLGLTAGYLESRIDGNYGRAFNFGADATFKPKLWSTIRLYGRNFGTKVKYNAISEMQPIQAGFSIQIDPFLNNDTTLNKSRPSLSVGIGALKTADLPLQTGIGIKFNPIKQLTINCGYEYFYDYKPDWAGISFGAGLLVNGYGGNIAFKYQSPEFGWIWSASIIAGAEEITQRTAMDYYKISEKHFKKKRYNLCIEFAKKALRLNPDLWQAHELIRRSVAIKRRKNGSEIVLIYTGNNKGQFIPFKTKNGTGTIGGLARQATIINGIREKFLYSCTIDVGNMLEKKTYKLRADFVKSYFSELKYDVLGLGYGEYLYGLSDYCKKEKNLNLSFLNSNIKGLPGSNIVKDRSIKLGKYSIAVLSLINPANNDKNFKPILDVLQRKMNLVRVRNADLKILILHDSWNNIKAISSKLKDIDIVLCGSVNQKFQIPVKIDSTIFLSTGVHGEYVGAISLRFDKKNKLISYNNKLYPLTDKVKSDPIIESKLKSIAVNIGNDENTLKNDKEFDTTGIFTFVSDRHGAPNIYLKIVKENLEYPLTFSSLNSSNPKISFKSKKIIYIEKDSKKKSADLKIMDLTGANKINLNLGGRVIDACFSPSGSWVYASVMNDSSKLSDIYRIRTNGGLPIKVIDWEDGSEQEISFSSNGENLLFTGNRDGNWQIYLSDTVGRTPIRISDAKADHIHPIFSPNGKFIAYLSDQRNFGKKMDLWIHDIETGKDFQITVKRKIGDFCWLQDNKTIIYSELDTTNTLMAIDIYTKKPINLIKYENLKEKNFNENRPKLIKFKNDSRIIYIKEFLSGKKQIFWVKNNGLSNKIIVKDLKNNWIDK